MSITPKVHPVVLDQGLVVSRVGLVWSRDVSVRSPVVFFVFSGCSRLRSRTGNPKGFVELLYVLEKLAVGKLHTTPVGTTGRRP